MPKNDRGRGGFGTRRSQGGGKARPSRDAPRRENTSGDRPKKRFSSERSDNREGKPFSKEGGSGRPKRNFSDRSEPRTGERSDNRPYKPKGDRPDRDRPEGDRPKKRFSSERSDNREGKPFRQRTDRPDRDRPAGDRPKKRFSSERSDNREGRPFSKEGNRNGRPKHLSSDRAETRAHERGEGKPFRQNTDRPDRDGSAGERPEKKFFSDRGGQQNRERKPFRSKDGRPERSRDFTKPERPLHKSVHAGPAPKLQKIERNKPERIAKFIARCGIASRRGSEELIEEGRVLVNGKRVTSPALNVTMQDVVTVNGKQIIAEAEPRIFLYYKPVGLVTTHKDPEGRPTVFASLPKAMPRVISIGRLDVNSEGLLLLTTSGDIAHQLEDPAQGWKRTYRVRAYGTLTESQMQLIRKGITIEGMNYKAADIDCEGRSEGKNAWYSITITEGKNREVRKMFEYFDCKVSRLIRVSFGNLQLSDMKPGDIREIPLSLLEGSKGRR